jgi:hypothetical protein
VTAWADIFDRLLALYEADNTRSGNPVEALILDDWRIFSFTDPGQVREFLISAGFGKHRLLQAGTRAKLRTSSGVRNLFDPLSWASFCDEIKGRNRFFPTESPDLDALDRIIWSSTTTVTPDAQLYRGRIAKNGKFLATGDMGAPPAELARGGRANPSGIPHLYLGLEIETCIHELRASQDSLVAVAGFHVSRDLELLQLVDPPLPDFLDVEDPDAEDQQIARVHDRKYLRLLGKELSQPVRSTDLATEYIPTQYLCELAKSKGLGGVRYGSSANPGGQNLVLFDPFTALCDGDPTHYVITEVRAEWRPA